MWGIDSFQVHFRLERLATVFIAVDHCVADVDGIHVVQPVTRFEALEPIYQGAPELYGLLDQGTAEGLVLRYDPGPQYMSHAFQTKFRFLGIESSPASFWQQRLVEVAERFIRMLKQQLLEVQIFNTVEELRQLFREFKKRDNEHWLLQRHDYDNPTKGPCQPFKVGKVSVILQQNSAQHPMGFTTFLIFFISI